MTIDRRELHDQIIDHLTERGQYDDLEVSCSWPAGSTPGEADRMAREQWRIEIRPRKEGAA